MRDLEYKNPYKIHHSRICPDVLNDIDYAHYERSCTVFTHYGLVSVCTMKWKHNLGKDEFSVFSTVVSGHYYSAWLNEGKISDRQIKWLATHFIKHIIKTHEHRTT